MHVLTTGAVLASVEEIKEFKQSEGDSSDVEESGPIVKRDNRGAQRSAPPRPKTSLFTDPSAVRDNFPLLDRAGSTLTDSSNNADEVIDTVLKHATRNAQRSAPPPTSTSPLQFEEENMSRPEVVFEGVNAHTVFAESKMEMALRIHSLRRKCESLERVCRQYKRCKGPIRYMIRSRAREHTHARTHGSWNVRTHSCHGSRNVKTSFCKCETSFCNMAHPYVLKLHTQICKQICTRERAEEEGEEEEERKRKNETRARAHTHTHTHRQHKQSSDTSCALTYWLLTTRWCNVGINLTRDIPHIVCGEVSAKDANGVKQDSPGYLGIAIYPGDRLVSIDDWNVENKPIGIIKTALRGPVHSLAKMKFLRRVQRGKGMTGDLNTTGNLVNMTTEYVDFSFEVEVLRVEDSNDGKQTQTTSQSLYGLLAVRDKANSLMGFEKGNLHDPVIPGWARPVNPKLTSKDVSSWMTNDSTSPNKPMMLRSRASSIDPTGDNSFSQFRSGGAKSDSPSDPYLTHKASFQNVSYGAGENSLSQVIADLMDPDSPRACDSADPWVFVL